MKAAQILLSTTLFGVPSIAQTYTCLPANIKENDVASVATVRSKTGKTSVEKITVNQTLKAMGSRCTKGNLVDKAGKQIRFYFLHGCWGNPPADYLGILNRQRIELDRLKKQYSVIEITCNPSGSMPY